MDFKTPVAVAKAWQEAVNRQDVDELLELSDPNIEIVGPRGSGYGHQLLREWMERARWLFTTRRVFSKGNTVILAQRGEWRPDDDNEESSEANFASCFRIAGQRVTQFSRHDNLDTALERAQLSYNDEMTI